VLDAEWFPHNCCQENNNRPTTKKK
jgi:hypothetical protein